MANNIQNIPYTFDNVGIFSLFDAIANPNRAPDTIAPADLSNATIEMHGSEPGVRESFRASMYGKVTSALPGPGGTQSFRADVYERTLGAASAIKTYDDIQHGALLSPERWNANAGGYKNGPPVVPDRLVPDKGRLLHRIAGAEAYEVYGPEYGGTSLASNGFTGGDAPYPAAYRTGYGLSANPALAAIEAVTGAPYPASRSIGWRLQAGEPSDYDTGRRLQSDAAKGIGGPDMAPPRHLFGAILQGISRVVDAVVAQDRGRVTNTGGSGGGRVPSLIPREIAMRNSGMTIGEIVSQRGAATGKSGLTS